jgi:hypothetical protein
MAMLSIVGVMLEIVVCAGAAAVTTYLIVEKRELRQFTSAKAEELYTLLEAFDRGLSAYLSQACAMLADGQGHSPHSDAIWTKLMQESAKSRMLINFYFPALLPHAKRADIALAATIGALRRFQANYNDEPPALALEQTLLDLRETLDTLKHAVVMAHRDASRSRVGSGRAAATVAPTPRMAF